MSTTTTAQDQLQVLQRDLLTLSASKNSSVISSKDDFITNMTSTLSLLARCWDMKAHFRLLDHSAIRRVIGIGKGALSIAALSAERHLWHDNYRRPVVTLLMWSTPIILRRNNFHNSRDLAFAFIKNNIDHMYARAWADEGVRGLREVLDVAMEALKFCSGATVKIEVENQRGTIDVSVGDIEGEAVRSRLMDLVIHILRALAIVHADFFADHGTVVVFLLGWKVYVPKDTRLFHVGGNELWHVSSSGKTSIALCPDSTEEALEYSWTLQMEHGDDLFSRVAELVLQQPTGTRQYLSVFDQAARVLGDSIGAIGLPGIPNKTLFTLGLQALQKLSTLCDDYWGSAQRSDDWMALPFFQNHRAPPERRERRVWEAYQHLRLMQSSDWTNPAIFESLTHTLTLCSRARVKVQVGGKALNLPPLLLADHSAKGEVRTAENHRYVELALVMAANILQFHFPNHDVKLWGHNFHLRPGSLEPFALGGTQRACALAIDQDLRALQQTWDRTGEPDPERTLACVKKSQALLRKIATANPHHHRLQTREWPQKRFEAAQQVITELSDCVWTQWALTAESLSLSDKPLFQENTNDPDTRDLLEMRRFAILDHLDIQSSAYASEESLDAGVCVLRMALGYEITITLRDGTLLVCPKLDEGEGEAGYVDILRLAAMEAMSGLAMFVSARFGSRGVMLWDWPVYA